MIPASSAKNHKTKTMTTKRSTLLGKPLAAAAIAIVFANTSHGFGGPPGGPFGNGSNFPNDGTFSAVVRGENLSGTLQFSTTAGSGPSNQSVTQSSTVDLSQLSVTDSTTTSQSGGVGSTGVATIFFSGDTLQGNAQGSLNAQSSTLAVNFQTDAQGQGERTIQVQEAVETQQALPVTGPDGNITGYVSVNATQFQTTREIHYFDALYLTGFANCKTSNAFPNQQFKGTGEAEFQTLIFAGNTPFLDATTFPVSVNGVRLSNTASSFATSDVRPPSVNEFSVLVE
jgi:hypothetical protein